MSSAGHIQDMINRMRIERSNRKSKKDSYSKIIEAHKDLSIKGTAINDVMISSEELEDVKQNIRKEIRNEKRKNKKISIVVISIVFLIILYVFVF